MTIQLQSLLIGSLGGGGSITFATVPMNEGTVDIVSWTTMMVYYEAQLYNEEDTMQKPYRSYLSILLAGLLVGAGLGILVLFPRFRGLSLIIDLVVLLILCGYTGYRATASTGKVGSGGRVGCQISLISSVLFIVVGVIYFRVDIDRILVPNPYF